MTEEANKHKADAERSYKEEHPDSDAPLTSNDVDLADYPGKAEALAEGQEAREEAAEEVDTGGGPPPGKGKPLSPGKSGQAPGHNKPPTESEPKK